MEQYIKKSALVAEIERRIKKYTLLQQKPEMSDLQEELQNKIDCLNSIKGYILNTFEVKDPYEQCVQYDSIKADIKAHAEEYSFNIESELFNQLTKEQQKLWRKEIERAVISGGYCCLNLVEDPRYKENLEAKEVGVWKTVDNINPPQADRNKIYCVFTNDRYILATVINHPQDEELLQWKCTEFPFHRYDMCEGDKYMQIV